MSDEPQKASIWHRLYHGETAFDFIGPKRKWFAFSAVVILIGLASLATRGLNFGIDFRGGVAWEVETTDVSVSEARDALDSLGQGDAKIQVLGGHRVRVQGDVSGKTAAERRENIDEVAAALAKVAKVPAGEVSSNVVGPSWGKNITDKARNALVAFLVVITLYITFRFELKMALAALSALFHDILVTVGVYSVSGFEVTPATVIAFLTILGYSLYDTIVVFDKVEENTRGLASTGRLTYGETVNLSMNQVLMRSLNTSLVAILPILSVLVIGAYVLGATTLKDFGLALFIGLMTGAYSSIYIASPVLAILKEREPRYASIKARVEQRGTRGPLTPAAAAAQSGGLGGVGTAAPSSAGASAARGAGRSNPAPAAPRPRQSQPRPRKKGKRR